VEAPTEFPLCIADDATFWAWKSWPQFADFPHRAKAVVVIPIAGMADWDPGWPLDAEEQLLLRLLKAAAGSLAPAPWLVCLPPLRFALGPDERCAFPIDQPTAHALVAEVVRSVAAAGFRRIVLYNSSPYNEELCAAAGRDLRLELGLDLFCLHLSALGLDFDASRGSDQALLRLAVGSDAQGPDLSVIAVVAARLARGLKEVGA